VVVSERLFDRLPEGAVRGRAASLALKGKREEEAARVIDLARSAGGQS
jgi:hypothetical protein